MLAAQKNVIRTKNDNFPFSWQLLRRKNVGPNNEKNHVREGPYTLPYSGARKKPSEGRIRSHSLTTGRGKNPVR